MRLLKALRPRLDDQDCCQHVASSWPHTGESTHDAGCNVCKMLFLLDSGTGAGLAECAFQGAGDLTGSVVGMIRG